MEDPEIRKRIQSGDAATFDDLYRLVAPRLREFVKQITGDLQIAEDIVQETFTQIWKKPSGFDPQRGSLRAYLFGIGRKRAAEWWRPQRRKRVQVKILILVRAASRS